MTSHGDQKLAVNGQVTAWSKPYDQWYELYQTFYKAGLRDAAPALGLRYTELSMGRFPGLVRALAALRYTDAARSTLGRIPRALPIVDRLVHSIEGPIRAPAGRFTPIVGQYELTDGIRTRRFCIDAHDSGTLAAPELLEWADLYFKTNYWPDQTYNATVVPEVNGTVNVAAQLPRLIGLRNAEPQYDICAILRVWGGRNELEGIEHNLRILEAVNKVPGRKYLLACLVAGDRTAIAERLAKQGIPSTTKLMPLHQLWEISSRSRLNIIRLGMHQCAPWRLIELLAIGGAVVLDRALHSVWPAPLVVDQDYVELGLNTDLDQPLLAPERYQEIPERLGALLSENGRIKALQQRAAEYFDDHAAPLKTGERILRKVLSA